MIPWWQFWHRYEIVWEGFAAVGAIVGPLATWWVARRGYDAIERQNKENQVAENSRFTAERVHQLELVAMQHGNSQSIEVAKALIPLKFEAADNARQWSSRLFYEVTNLHKSYTRAVVNKTPIKDWQTEHEKEISDLQKLVSRPPFYLAIASDAMKRMARFAIFVEFTLANMQMDEGRIHELMILSLLWGDSERSIVAELEVDLKEGVPSHISMWDLLAEGRAAEREMNEVFEEIKTAENQPQAIIDVATRYRMPEDILAQSKSILGLTDQTNG